MRHLFFLEMYAMVFQSKVFPFLPGHKTTFVEVLQSAAPFTISHLVLEYRLTAFYQKKCVMLIGILRHFGVEGNKRADTSTKKSSAIPFHTPEPTNCKL